MICVEIVVILLCFLTPISVDIKNRLISYWTKLITDMNLDNCNNINNNAQQKLSSKMYTLVYELSNKNKIKSPWIDNIKNILCTSGYSGIWYSQSFTNANGL